MNTEPCYATRLRKIVASVLGIGMVLTLSLGVSTLVSVPDAHATQAKWVHQGKVWKYQKSNGSYATGWIKTGGHWYYLDAKGIMQTGWFKDTSGTWYYANGSGAMQTGWLKQGGTWYYLKGSGAMATGWQKVHGTWYYFYQSGAMATGWAHDGEAWYHMASSGAMQTGWLKQGGTWYYLSGSGAAKQNAWLSSGGTWYYFKDSCAMATGWAKAKDNNWYYFAGSGAMQTGWQYISGEWYAFDSSGAMRANTWVTNSTSSYWLTSSGAMARSAWVDQGRYYVNASGRWTGQIRSAQNGSTSSNTSNSNKPETTTPDVKPKYSYEVYSIKTPQPIYGSFCLYIKTTNPDANSLQLVTRDLMPTNVRNYADVPFSEPDNVADYFEKVPGGYLVEIEDMSPYTGEDAVGTFEITLKENGISASKFSVTIADYTQAEQREFDRILALVAKPGMNSLEKFQAAAHYIQQNWHYSSVKKRTNPGQFAGYASLLSEKGTWWQSHQLNSYTSPAMLCRLAKYIGGFSDIHNCYGDYAIGTPEWMQYHAYCRVTFKGKEHYVFACPWSETAHVVDPATEPKVSFSTSGILGAKLS